MGNIRGSKAYKDAFVSALRDNVTPDTALGEKYAPLLAVLTEGTGADGGFLVPEDIDNQVRDLRRQYVSLAELITVENVSTKTGWRVKDTASTGGGFVALDSREDGEGAALAQDSQPLFAKQEFSLATYGLIVPMSRELVDDEVGGLMNYLARWTAKKLILTENSLILNELDTKLDPSATPSEAPGEGEELEALKTALNVTLDPAHSNRAQILTNQTGFNILDSIVDTDGYPLLQPDISDDAKFTFLGYPVIRMSDAHLPNGETVEVYKKGTVDTNYDVLRAPIYVGDFEQFATLFRHPATEMASSDVGGSAWSNYMREVRIIARLDVSAFDDNAVTKLRLFDSKEEKQYTLSFDTGEGGTVIEPITDIAGATITAPDAPEREGFTFDSWTPVVPTKMPKVDTECVAQWTEAAE